MIDYIFEMNYNPKFIMSDGSYSIRNACEKIFDKPTLLLCKFHFQKNLN